MNTVTELVNAALGRIGGGRLDDFDSDTGTTAERCRDNYALCRDAVLRAGYWNCAMTRAQLVAGGPAPAWGFTTAFPLPTGTDAALPYCLRVVEIDGQSARTWGNKWKVEYPKRIVANTPGPLNVLYIARIENVAFYDASLVDAIAQRLAATLAYPITNNRAVAADKWQVYAGMIREAKSVDAQEGLQDGFGPDPDFIADGWLESRLG